MQAPITSETLKRFETAFHFNINIPLREFLMCHNDSKIRHCDLTTNVKERRIATILNFAEGGNAWAINRRMRKLLGNKYIVIGTDRTDNFLCVRRNKMEQSLVIWNHITNTIEECTCEIPILLMQWTKTIERSQDTL